MSYRLPAPAGTRIDRSRPLTFTFNGRRYGGFQGDTLASALLAQGARLVGRSFKLHRPRGVWSCGVEEPNAIVDLGAGGRRTPNVRATLLPLVEGLSAASVNCWPSVGFDVGALTGAFGALLPAGFYYKTFKWPSWRWFEPAIRRMAGLGIAPDRPDPDHYEEVSAQVDVLVVGGGSAGLMAAASAARAGAETWLLSGGVHLGGALGWRADAEAMALEATASAAGVRILRRTLAFGLYDHNLLCAIESVSEEGGHDLPACVLRERLWKIRARTVIAATGAFERPLVFPDNDRPGVMLAGAALKYAFAYGVACGRRAVIATASDWGYAVAAALRTAGTDIVAIVDRRASGAARLEPSGVHVAQGMAIAGVFGRRAVRGCRTQSLTGAGSGEHLDCDLILNTAGFAPAVHLHSQAGGRLRWLEAQRMFVPDGAAQGVVSVGACAGVFDSGLAHAHAAAVGEALARGRQPPEAPVGGDAGRAGATRPAGATGPPGHPSPAGPAHPDDCRPLTNLRGKQFIDLQNDVSTEDVALAARENYRSVEHLKRYTTTGMGTDQGKTSNINALLLLGEYTGSAPAQVGTTRFRPPFAPVTLGAIAGRRAGSRYRPLKDLPAHDWHARRGAVFDTYGDWRRPTAYPRQGESIEQAMLREAGIVREHAGLFDGSPLGKLEIFGPDAAHFLDLMYVGTMSNLAIGQARYGVLLNEHGTLVDDGIVARLGEQHYWVNTSTAGAERTAAAFEEWLQCEFLRMKVLVTPVTSRWGNVTVAGPRAWQWLESVGLDAALAPTRMKHMTLRASALDGVPLRVLRASFSGELGYELNVPVEHTERLFARLWERAAEIGAALYGIEALQVLRIEKGYLHIGSDTDGTTLPTDVGLARGIERKPAAFVGRRSLSRPAALDPQRLQLIGLEPLDSRTLLHVGAHIAPHAPPAPIEGRVTSSCWSPALGRPIALALLSRGAQRIGEQVRVYHLGGETTALVVKTPFLDPEGRRVHG